VVFFYQKQIRRDARSVWFRDNFDRFQANNYELLGVSADAARLKPSSKTNTISFATRWWG
jgi:peroxiredoxin